MPVALAIEALGPESPNLKVHGEKSVAYGINLSCIGINLWCMG